MRFLLKSISNYGCCSVRRNCMAHGGNLNLL